MSKALRTVTVLLGVAAMLGGCSSKGAAKTPKEAVSNFAKALEKGDKDLFLSSVNVGPDDKEFVDALFDVMAVTTGIAKDMEKAYGKDAGGDVKRGMAIITDEELAKLEIKEEGDKATAKPPQGGKPMPLVKKNGVWLVDISEEMPPPDDRKKMVEQFKAMAKALGEVRAKVGKPGMTKEKIGMEMMGAMMKAGMGDEMPTTRPAP